MKMNSIIEGELINLLSKQDKKDLDIHAIWDDTLTKDENYNHILGDDWRRLKELEKSKIKIEEKEFETEQLKRLEDKTKKDLNKSIKEISKSTNNKIDKYFLYLNEYVDTLINSKSIFGLIISGSSSIGKSFSVIKRLSDNKLQYDKDWIMLKAHISPMEFYHYLWKYQDKIIILDDCSNLFENEEKVNILMSALYSATGKRIVMWQTSSEKLEAPTSFEFKGKILMLTNKFPENLDVLKTRCFFYQLAFSYENMLKLTYEIGKIHNIPIEVLDFIRTHSCESSNLNFRTIFKINEIYTTNMNNGWEKLANLELEVDDDKQIFFDAIKSHSQVKDACKDFIEKSGLSRRTFYRFKQQLVPKVSLF